MTQISPVCSAVPGFTPTSPVSRISDFTFLSIFLTARDGSYFPDFSRHFPLFSLFHIPISLSCFLFQKWSRLRSSSSALFFCGIFYIFTGVSVICLSCEYHLLYRQVSSARKKSVPMAKKSRIVISCLQNFVTRSSRSDYRIAIILILKTGFFH